MGWKPSFGAWPEGKGTRFRVWADQAQGVDVVIYERGAVVRTHALKPEPGGYFSGFAPGIAPGTRYMYRLDGGVPRPGIHPCPGERPQVGGPAGVVPMGMRQQDGPQCGPVQAQPGHLSLQHAGLGIQPRIDQDQASVSFDHIGW